MGNDHFCQQKGLPKDDFVHIKKYSKVPQKWLEKPLDPLLGNGLDAFLVDPPLEDVEREQKSTKKEPTREGRVKSTKSASKPFSRSLVTVSRFRIPN